MDIRWAVIRSYHAVAPPVSATVRTRCGRWVGSAENVVVHDQRPAGKTCETCLRIIAREVDG